MAIPRNSVLNKLQEGTSFRKFDADGSWNEYFFYVSPKIYVLCYNISKKVLQNSVNECRMTPRCFVSLGIHRSILFRSSQRLRSSIWLQDGHLAESAAFGHSQRAAGSQVHSVSSSRRLGSVRRRVWPFPFYILAVGRVSICWPRMPTPETRGSRVCRCSSRKPREHAIGKSRIGRGPKSISADLSQQSDSHLDGWKACSTRRISTTTVCSASVKSISCYRN